MATSRMDRGGRTCTREHRRDRAPRRRMRREYAGDGLTEDDLAPTGRASSARWLADAVAAGLPEPNAMVVATADAAGRPERPHGAAQGLRRARLRLLHQLRLPQGRRAAPPTRTPALVFPWYPAAPPGVRRRRGRAGRPGRDRGVLRRAGRAAPSSAPGPARSRAVIGRPGRRSTPRYAADGRALPGRRPSAGRRRTGAACGSYRRRSSSGRAASSRLHDRLRYRRDRRRTSGSSSGSRRDRGDRQAFRAAARHRRHARCGYPAYRRLCSSATPSRSSASSSPRSPSGADVRPDPVDSLWVGLLGVAGLVPLIVFALWGGAVADARRPAPVLLGQLAADVGRRRSACSLQALLGVGSPVAAARCWSRCSRRRSRSARRPAGDHARGWCRRTQVRRGEHAELHDVQRGRRCSGRSAPACCSLPRAACAVGVRGRRARCSRSRCGRRCGCPRCRRPTGAEAAPAGSREPASRASRYLRRHAGAAALLRDRHRRDGAGHAAGAVPARWPPSGSAAARRSAGCTPRSRSARCSAGLTSGWIGRVRRQGLALVLRRRRLGAGGRGWPGWRRRCGWWWCCSPSPARPTWSARCTGRRSC